MEKLKLEEVTPYLPYGLRIFDIKSSKKYELIPYKRQYERLDKKMTIQEYMNFNIIDCKPILRPLSDLTKEIEINGKKFIPIEKIDIWFKKTFYKIKKSGIEKCKAGTIGLFSQPYEVIEKLHEWHFDTEGLIEKGLAIDINTLK